MATTATGILNLTSPGKVVGEVKADPQNCGASFEKPFVNNITEGH